MAGILSEHSGWLAAASCCDTEECTGLGWVLGGKRGAPGILSHRKSGGGCGGVWGGEGGP